MIDWDDFDWRKVAGAIILAVLVIAAAIFVVEDYMSANRMKNNMQAQLNALNDFEAKYQPPGKPELEAMSLKIDALAKEASKIQPKLGDTVDVAVVQKKINNLAATVNVKMEKMEFQPESKENFMKVYPASIVVTGTNEQLSKFMGGLTELGVPWRQRGEPSTSVGRIEMAIDFLAYDQAEWDKSFSCDLGVKVPENIDVNISKVRIFKTTASDLAAQVDSMQLKLADAKKSLNEKCGLERQIAGLENRIKRARELAK
jgi:Tfp pilus assembly protein PilO